VPFTTSFGDSLYPFEVLVPADECALAEDSVALCSQIRTVSIQHRVTENIGSIPAERMADVDAALEYSPVSYPQIESLPRSMNPTENPDLYRYNTLMELCCRSRLPAFSTLPPLISPPESLLTSIFRLQIEVDSV
jgi:hypothetical protein